MAPALTEAGQSQNFALTSSNCSPIGLRNGSVGGTVEGIGSPRGRTIESPGAVSDIPGTYVSCKQFLIDVGGDGNGVDEAAFENLNTLAIASELFKPNKPVKLESAHVVNGHIVDTVGAESVNGGGALGQLWYTTGMSTNLPEETTGDADGSEATDSLPMPTDELGQNVRDLLEVIQGMEKTEATGVQDPFASERKASVSSHVPVRTNEESIFSSSNHDGASAFDLPNGPVDGIYPVADLDCNLTGVDMMSMCVVELPGGSSANGMGSGAGALLDPSSLGVGGNPGGLLDGGGLDSQLALDSHLTEDGLCVSREVLSGERKCEVQRRQAEVERKIERLLRRIGKVQARRMGRHAAEELRVVVEHAKQSLSNLGAGPGRGPVSGVRRTEPHDLSLTGTEPGIRPPFLSSYIQDVASDPAAGLRIGRTGSGTNEGGTENSEESLVKSEDVRNLPTATLESLAQRLDKVGAGKLTKKYFGSGSPRARLEEVVEGAVAAAEIGTGVSRTEDSRRGHRRRKRYGDAEEDEEAEEFGRKKLQVIGDVDVGDEKRRRRRLEEERFEVKRDGDVKVVVVRRSAWGCGEGTEEAEVDEAFGKLAAQLRVVEKEIDSDATASSSGAESADEAVSGFSASATGTLSIGRRAAWKWARDRSWVGSRWTWLQAQISDLEYRIRQHSEFHRQIRASKGALVFAKPNDQTHQLSQTVVVNGFHHTELGKNTEGCAGEGDTCCRVRPLRSLPRKRRLLRASDPGGPVGDGGKRGRGNCVSPPSQADEVLCTGCHQNALHVPSCVLCSAPRRGQNAPSLTAPRAPPPSSLPIPERVARIDTSFHPILSFPRDISADIHVGAIMKTQSWQQEVLSEKGKPSLTNFSSSNLSGGRSGGTTAGQSRRRRGGSIGGARRGGRRTLSVGAVDGEEQEDGGLLGGTEFSLGSRGGSSLSSRRRNYTGFRIKKVSSNALTPKLRHKLSKGRRGRGRVGGNHCDPLQRLKQKRLKSAMSPQSACEEADEQLRMELRLGSGTFSAPGTAPPSPFPPASPASPGSTSPHHHSSASSTSSTTSSSLHHHHHHHHHHSPYSLSSTSIAAGSNSLGNDKKASLLHELLSRRKRESSYDIDNIVIPHSIAASTRVEKLPYKEILTPKWRVVEPFPPKKLECGDNGVVRRSSHESEEEDVSAEAVAERHERCEQEEHKRFLRLLKRPHGANSGSGEGKSHGGGRGGHRRGRADSRAESSGQNTPDPMSPDHHSACPSPSPLSVTNSPPPTPIPLPPLLEENPPASPEVTDISSAPNLNKNPSDGGSQSSSSVKPQEGQSSAISTASVVKNLNALEAAAPSPLKNVDGRVSGTESPASSPFKIVSGTSKVNNSGSKGSKGWTEGPASSRRRTVSLTHLHPLSGGRERSSTPIDPYDEYPLPKPPYEPYVFPLSDEQYKVMLGKMPPGHHFPPICPSQTSQPSSQPSSQASSTSGDGATESTQAPAPVASSKNGNSSEQISSAPRSPCSETTESVLEEDDRGDDDLVQGDLGDDDPDWTLQDEVRGRASKR